MKIIEIYEVENRTVHQINKKCFLFFRKPNRETTILDNSVKK